MAAKSKLPLWLWWAAGSAAVIAAAAGAVWLVGGRALVVPPAFAEKRQAVARLLEEASRTEDVDIKPLLALEAKRDYKGAVALMSRAIEVNARQEELNLALVGLSDELTRLSLGVGPDEIGARAVEAFSLLAKLTEAEKKFFENRRELYQLTQGYYADLAARKNPPIPPNLRALVDTVNADLERAKNLHREFTLSVRAFDEAVAGR